MVRIVKCPQIARDKGLSEVYGDWPLLGVPEQSMKNKKFRRSQAPKLIIPESMDLGSDCEEFEEFV